MARVGEYGKLVPKAIGFKVGDLICWGKKYTYSNGNEERNIEHYGVIRFIEKNYDGRYHLWCHWMRTPERAVEVYLDDNKRPNMENSVNITYMAFPTRFDTIVEHYTGNVERKSITNAYFEENEEIYPS